MQTKVFLQQTSNLFTENRLLKFVIVVLALAVGVNSFMVSRAVRNQRVILIPPKLTGTIEFVAGKPSDQYIRDLARRLASLAATYSPRPRPEANSTSCWPSTRPRPTRTRPRPGMPWPAGSRRVR